MTALILVFTNKLRMHKESTNGREEGEEGTAMGERKERGERPWVRGRRTVRKEEEQGTEREKENVTGGTRRVRNKKGGVRH